MDSFFPLLLLLNLASTLYMTGVIYFVQIVHYPLLNQVGKEHFQHYEASHVQRTGLVVMLPMVLELATSFALVFTTVLPRYQTLSAFALVLALWLSTALLQVPCHRTLSHGFDEQAYRRLVASNWLRTILWTLRSLLLLYWLYRL